MKPFNYFLLLSFAICVAAAVCGCKARKVDKFKSETLVNSSNDTRSGITTLVTDTGKRVVRTHTTTTLVVNNRDSGTLKNTIYPKAGIPFILDSDGTFRGEADSAKTEFNGIKNRRRNKHTHQEKTDTTTNGFSTAAVAETTQHTSTMSKSTVEEKHVTAKPDHSWILWAAGVLLLGYFLYRFFRK